MNKSALEKIKKIILKEAVSFVLSTGKTKKDINEYSENNMELKDVVDDIAYELVTSYQYYVQDFADDVENYIIEKEELLETEREFNDWDEET